MTDNNVIVFKDNELELEVNVAPEEDTVWLTQAQMAQLFQTTAQNITIHLKNIYNDNELDEAATCKDFLQVRQEGRRTVRRKQKYYNLDMILAIGFRVRSPRGTQFRQWANSTLKEYLLKGFVMDDERLKNPDGRPDYFDELLERIRDIRASEKRFYQKLRDLFALSSDYIPNENTTKLFFAETQNKLIYGVTGQTAAELIMARANADKPNMALTSWQGSIVRKSDIITAKNYLLHDELDSLNRLVNIFLESAEFRVKKRKDLTLEFWRASVDKLLLDHDVPLLQAHGKVSHKQAIDHANKIYENFDARRKAVEAKEADQADLLELEQTTAKIKSIKK